MSSSCNHSRIFRPMDGLTQRHVCSLLNVPFISEHKFKQSKQLGAPIKRHSINGDGNCLFRALSFVITGRQNYYRSIRQKIVSHMKEIEFALQPHINCPLEDYLLNSKIASDKTWGTDIEILTASSLLNTDIYVYTKTGKTFCWHRFSKQLLHGNELLPVHEHSIYLYHENEVHYDVVLDVEGVEIEKCEAQNKIQSDFTGSNYPISSEVRVEQAFNASSTPSFSPVNKSSQNFLCSLLNVPFISEHNIKQSKPLGEPIKRYSINGDGNCLFRALSFVMTIQFIYTMKMRCIMMLFWTYRGC